MLSWSDGWWFLVLYICTLKTYERGLEQGETFPFLLAAQKRIERFRSMVILWAFMPNKVHWTYSKGRQKFLAISWCWFCE